MSPSAAPPDRRHHTLPSRLTTDAIEVDHGSALFFVSFPEGFKPQQPPQLGRADDEGQEQLYLGTQEYVYRHFLADFGPLHLEHVYSFCRKLGRLLEMQRQQHQQEGGGRRKRPVYVYSSDHPHRRSNAAVLVLAYAVSRTKDDAVASKLLPPVCIEALDT